MFGYCACACRTCPMCGGHGLIPAPYVRPRPLPVIPWVHPILVRPVVVMPEVPGHGRSRGAARDMSLALA